MSLPLLALASCATPQESPPPDPTRDITAAWASADRDVVLRAAQEAVDRWESWSERDLRSLTQAAAQPGVHRQELRDTLTAISVRRALGRAIMTAVPTADEWACGEARVRILLIDRVIAQAQRGRLTPEDVREFARYVRTSGWDLPRRYVCSLAQHEPFRPMVVDLLQGDHAPTRAEAAMALGRAGCSAARDALTRSLSDSNAGVRCSSATAIMLADIQPAPRELAALLGDEDAAVRAAAVRALGWVGGPEALTSIAGLLADPQEPVRTAAVVAATWAGGLSDGQIRALLNDSGSSVRQALARALRSHRSAVALDALLVLADDTSDAVRISAYLSLGWRLKAVEAVDRAGITAKLHEALDRKRAKNRQTAHTTAAALVALMRGGEEPKDLEDLHRTCSVVTIELYGELCVALLERFHPRAAAGLTHDVVLADAVASHQEAAAVLAPSDAKLDTSRFVPFDGRFAPGRTVTGWTLLSRLPGDGVVTVGENGLQLMPALAAVTYWRETIERSKK